MLRPFAKRTGWPTVERNTAVNLLGGTVALAAAKLDLTSQAVYKWPQVGTMPRLMCDRVLATWLRLEIVKNPALRTQLRLPADALATPSDECNGYADTSPQQTA